MPRKRALTVIAPALLLFLWPARPVRATGQVRMYFDVQGSVLRAKKSPPDLSLFGREESRFWSDGLEYVKTSAGARARVRAWLSLAAYYAHQDYVSPEPKAKHMAVADVILAHRFGRGLGLGQRNEFEWHVTDAYFRYRCQLTARWTTPLRRLAIWGSGEFRVDADAGRVNMYNLLAGITIRLSKIFRLQPFYGYEATRRGKPSWTGTHYLGLLLGVRG